MVDNNAAPTGETPKDQEIKPDLKPEEPATRRSAKDFIIDRQARKIEKLESQKDKDDLGFDDELDDDEEITPAGKKTIEKTVGEAIAPIVNQARRQSDEAELSEVLAKYPHLKELEPKIRKWMEHPAYRDASIEIIALGVAAKEGKGADADRKRQEADKEAAAGALGGNQRRPQSESDGKIPDVRNMSKKDFDDLTFKVKTGQFK